MSEEVGTAHIGIVADTSQFKAELKALKAAAKRLGGAVGDSFVGDFARRANKGMRKFVASFRAQMTKLAADTKRILRRMTLEVAASFDLMRFKVINALQKTSTGISRVLQRIAFTMKAHVARAIAPLVASYGLLRARVVDEFDLLKTQVSASLRQLQRRLVLFALEGAAALDILRHRFRPLTNAISEQFTLMRTQISATLKQMSRRFLKFALEGAAAFDILNFRIRETARRVNKSINDFLTRTGIRGVLIRAKKFGIQMGRVIAEGWRVGSKTAQNAVRRGMEEFKLRVIIPLKTLGSEVAYQTRIIGARLGQVMNSRLVTETKAKMSRWAQAIKNSLPVTAVGVAVLRLREKLGNLMPRDGVTKFKFAMKKLQAAARIGTRSIANSFQRMARSISRSLRRMDSTVRLVVLAIAFAGNFVAALSSGLSAAAIALAAVAAGVVAALAPLAGILAPLALGVLAAVNGFKRIKELAPEAATALAGLKAQFKDVAVPALMKEWGDSLGKFFTSLKGFLSADIFAGIGKAFAGITDALAGVLNGDVGKQFKEALAGPLTDALATLGSALGPLLAVLLEFLTASAPYAQILADMFLTWATNLEKAFSGAVADGSFQTFMDKAITALTVFFDLIGNIGDVIGTVFSAGIGPGTELLQMLSDMVGEFAAWLKSAEGQAALTQFFDGIMVIMPPLLDLVGALGKGLADLVTPEIMAQAANLLTALADIVPVLSDLINIIGAAGILDILTAALSSLGDILKPLIGPATAFLKVFSGVLVKALDALAPTFTLIGEVLGEVLTAITPLLPILGDLLVSAISTLVPIILNLVKAFLPLLDMIFPLLQPLIDALVPALASIGNVVLRVLEALMPFVGILLQSLLPLLPALIDVITVLADIIGDVLVSALEIILPLIKPLLEMLGLLAPVIELLVPILELVGSLIDVITDAILWLLSPLLDWINNTDSITNGIKTFSEWVAKATVVIGGITAAIRNWIKNLDLGKWASDAWTNIKEAFQSMLDWMGKLPEKIGGFFTSIGTAIKNALGAAFDWIITKWNNTVGKLSWTVPSWIPGIGGSTFSAPKFAAGAIVNTPTMGIFGDAGAEALVPLNRPLNMVDPSVRGLSAIAQGLAVPGAGMNIAEGAIVIQTPATDGRVIAESVLDRIVTHSR